MRITLPLLALIFTNLTAAKHCYNLGENGKTDIAWDASYHCCMGDAFGVWISKDCKGALVKKVYEKCCRTYGCQMGA